MANRAAIEQQHRHLQPVLARKLRVGIDVHHAHHWNGLRAFELGQCLQHLIAQVTALAADDHEARWKRSHRRDYLRRGAGARLMPWAALDVAFTWLAMNSTVFGGTSPMAVTW